MTKAEFIETVENVLDLMRNDESTNDVDWDSEDFLMDFEMLFDAEQGCSR